MAPRRRLSPTAAGIAAGLLFVATALVVHLRLVVAEYGTGLATGPRTALWVFGGAFFLVAVPASVSVRYRVYSPVIVATALYAWLLAASWSAMVESAQSPGAGLTATLFELSLWYWPLVVWIPLSAGAVEYGLRRLTSWSRLPAST
ncbi:hypothetical protein OB905_04875 [Halobacteria archaeon AArc-dxtr1]|nr:hypothetical protein [Halobacteria archaeon AArc-dxtr1]